MKYSLAPIYFTNQVVTSTPVQSHLLCGSGASYFTHLTQPVEKTLLYLDYNSSAAEQ